MLIKHIKDKTHRLTKYILNTLFVDQIIYIFLDDREVDVIAERREEKLPKNI